MKKTLSFLTIVLLISYSYAQDCSSYFPQEKGKQYVYSDLDKKGEKISTTVKTVVGKKNIPGGVKVSFKDEITAVDADTTTSIEYSVSCENGEMKIDLESYLMNNEQMNAYEDMEVKVNADELSLPKNAKAGDDLGGGSVVAEIFNSGTKMLTVTLNITERKVDAIEEVTTDAGTFKCVKVSSKMEMKMMIKFTYYVTEWYAGDIGVVKSESFNKKGKLKGTTVLTAIK